MQYVSLSHLDGTTYNGGFRMVVWFYLCHFRRTWDDQLMTHIHSVVSTSKLWHKSELQIFMFEKLVRQNKPIQDLSFCGIGEIVNSIFLILLHAAWTGFDMFYKYCFVASSMYNLALGVILTLNLSFSLRKCLDWSWSSHRLHLKSQRTKLSCNTGYTNHCSMHSFKMYRSVLIIQNHLLPSPRVNYRWNQCVCLCRHTHTLYTQMLL